MKKIFSLCFEKWWRPVLLLVLTFILLLASDYFDSVPFSNIVFALFLLSLLGTVGSLIYQLVKRKWKNAIGATIILCLTIGGTLYYSFISLFLYHPDHYADNLKIPNNIQINLPIDSSEPTNISIPDFYIYNCVQPGLYQYSFWTRRIEKGKVFLKAFEVTKNDPLSVDELKKRSVINVYNLTDSLVKFTMDKGNSELGMPFTIYEGEWGKPYAARFEVWYKPDDGGAERKVIEKNYKIEGWER